MHPDRDDWPLLDPFGYDTDALWAFWAATFCFPLGLMLGAVFS